MTTRNSSYVRPLAVAGILTLVATSALAAWPRQPGIEPTPRDTERLAQPRRRPAPSVLHDEPALHSDSFAK